MFKSSSSSQLSLLEEVNARSGPGVVLVDPSAAKPFLGIPPLVQHELGMVVLGANCPSQDANACQPISVPATTSEGSKVIVSACLHQVGSTKVLMAHHHENRIALPDSQVLVSRYTGMRLTLMPGTSSAPVLLVKSVTSSSKARSFF